ncbi:DUF418 domain-containing protein [Streptomyces sp. NPDC052040]|uniref:DUF418 domain-containing protein n=1 Tax=unclassified Streptomyces TaxID=2593676 RepID=UPI0037D0A147
MAYDAALTAPPARMADGRTPSTSRLVGVDLARGLAVFGMFAAHVGPDPDQGGVTGFLMELSRGRSSALFALLAGFAVVLITGRRTPKTGLAGRQAVAKVVIRAVILLALGSALTMWGTPIDVILAFYGLFFLLVLPLYRLGAGPLAALAAGTALVFPQLLYALAPMAGGIGTSPADGHPDGLVSLLLTGSYPALTWLSFVLAGMAVARLDLSSAAVRTRTALTGAALAVVGYGGSWLALHLFPGAVKAIAASGAGGSAASAWWSDTAGSPDGTTPAWMLAAAPHSETTLSIVANTGVAITVVALCLTAMDSFPRLRRLARPVVAVGSMSLTAYVLHILAIRVLGPDLDDLPGTAMHELLGFIVSAAVFATLWSRFFRRGPLEWLMGRATGLARYVPEGRGPRRARGDLPVPAQALP